MKLARDTGIFSDPTFENLRHSVEQAPSASSFRKFLVGGLIPLTHHLSDTLDVDHPFAVHAKYRVVSSLICERRSFVPLKRAVLGFPLLRKRFDHFANETGKIALGVYGVPALDDVIT